MPDQTTCACDPSKLVITLTSYNNEDQLICEQNFDITRSEQDYNIASNCFADWCESATEIRSRNEY